jgi:hypothetical protein
MLTKRLAIVASMILFTAIAGQASARREHSGVQHSTNAVTSSNNIHEPEFVPGAGTPSQSVEGIVHRLHGRTEVQRLSINPSNGGA